MAEELKPQEEARRDLPQDLGPHDGGACEAEPSLDEKTFPEDEMESESCSNDESVPANEDEPEGPSDENEEQDDDPSERVTDRTLDPSADQGEDDPAQADKGDTATGQSMCPDLPVHELAELFPLLEGTEYETFKEDIRQNGLREPILVYNGQIVDGRNRYRACKDLNILFTACAWDEQGSLADFVASKNIHRRHLNESVRAIIGARLKSFYEKDAQERMLAGKAADPMANLPQGTSRDLAAKAMNVSGRSVEAATKVIQQGVPELEKAVRKKQISVSAAEKLAELPPKKQAEIVAAGSKEMKAAAKKVREQKAKKSTAPKKDDDPVVRLTKDSKGKEMAELIITKLGRPFAVALHKALDSQLKATQRRRGRPKKTDAKQ